jgi:tetratricopeptide (TPR) repeat protein
MSYMPDGVIYIDWRAKAGKRAGMACIGDDGVLGAKKMVEDIMSGLTGDVARDAAYLTVRGRELQGLRMRGRVVREIGWTIFKLDPEGKAEAFREAFGADRLGLDLVLAKAERQMETGNYPRALNILESHMAKMSGAGICLGEKSESSYHHFRNILEIAICSAHYDEACVFKIVPEDMGKLHALRALALIRLERVEDALAALRLARSINPVRADILLLIADLDRLTGRMDDFVKTTNECLKCSYFRQELAKCYRNLACYYSFVEDYETACALCWLSMGYEASSIEAEKELVELERMAGRRLPIPDVEEIRWLCGEKGIPVGPNDEAIAFAYAIGEHLMSEGRYPKARFYFKILLDLTGSDEVKTILESLPK